MSTTSTYAVGLGVATLIVALSLGCASRHAALDRPAPSSRSAKWGGGPTPEEIIRQHDIRRLGSFSEFQDEKDGRPGSLDGEDLGATERGFPAPSRGSRILETAGKIMFSVVAVAATIGMAALPFLI